MLFFVELLLLLLLLSHLFLFVSRVKNCSLDEYSYVSADLITSHPVNSTMIVIDVTEYVKCLLLLRDALHDCLSRVATCKDSRFDSRQINSNYLFKIITHDSPVNK